MRKVLYLLIIPVLLIGCAKVKEAEAPQEQEGLHEVVFHAGWAPETRTELQEDGSVWWSPGDEISLFVNNGDNGGYKLTSTNLEVAPKADFTGQIGNAPANATYTAIFPYNEFNHVYDDVVYFTIPTEQVAKEGTFDSGLFVSYAVSDNESLFFRNLCSGIKFSVFTPGIKSIEIYCSNGAVLSGNINYTIGTGEYYDDGNNSQNYIHVFAPSESGFEVGRNYYAIIRPGIKETGVGVVYHQEGTKATWEYNHPIEFKTGVFKNLIGKDETLTFYYDSYSYVREDTIVPSDVDKSSITEAYFHVLSDKTTDTIIQEPSGWNWGHPIYWELDGTIAHYYTSAQAYTVLTFSNNFSGLFEGWSNLKTLDLSNFDFRRGEDFSYMFNGCHSLENLNLGTFENTVATNVNWMFNNCKKLKSLNLSNFHSDRITSTKEMFQYCMSLSSLDLSGFITDNVTDMSGMFRGCKSLESIDLSSFNTSKVTDMTAMFSGCSSLTEIDLSSFDTSDVESVNGMFGYDSFGTGNGSSLEGCSSLKSIDLSSWNTSKLKEVAGLFAAASSLASVNLSGWDTSNIVSTSAMFEYCTSLKTLDLSGFAPTNNENMDFMFQGCIALESLNIQDFTCKANSQAIAFLDDCVKLNQLDLGDMDLSKISVLDSFMAGTAFYRDRIAIRCNSITRNVIIENSASSAFDLNKVIWVGLDETMPEVSDDINPDWYYSSDYSKDKTVKVLQEATVGAGVDIVIFGDAYSDRLIADNTYESDIQTAIDGLFSYEPMKSFRNLFNVYMVYAVSTNEEGNGNTAVGIHNGRGSQLKTFNYAKCVAQGKTLSEVTLIVIGHDPNAFDLGTPGITVTSLGGGGDLINDYGSTTWSCAYISRIPDDSEFVKTVAHEFGHTFAKLADEYISKPGYSVDDWRYSMQSDMDNYGCYKNIDFTNNLSSIKWSKFITDPRYASEGLGAYEGATFDSGVWRPDENSLMREGDYFNAPSREAIYYRIHKLAYGRSWQYDFDSFVQQDIKNIRPQAPARYVPYPARIPHNHLFRREVSTSDDGGKIVTITMD